MPVAENVGGGAELSALRVGSRNQESNEAVSGLNSLAPPDLFELFSSSCGRVL